MLSASVVALCAALLSPDLITAIPYRGRGFPRLTCPIGSSQEAQQRCRDIFEDVKAGYCGRRYGPEGTAHGNCITQAAR
jgi:hypothetical protein